MRDSIIGAGLSLGAHARVAGAIIANGGIVPDGAVLEPQHEVHARRTRLIQPNGGGLPLSIVVERGPR